MQQESITETDYLKNPLFNNELNAIYAVANLDL